MPVTEAETPELEPTNPESFLTEVTGDNGELVEVISWDNMRYFEAQHTHIPGLANGLIRGFSEALNSRPELRSFGIQAQIDRYPLMWYMRGGEAATLYEALVREQIRIPGAGERTVRLLGKFCEIQNEK